MRPPVPEPSMRENRDRVPPRADGRAGRGSATEDRGRGSPSIRSRREQARRRLRSRRSPRHPAASLAPRRASRPPSPSKRPPHSRRRPALQKAPRPSKPPGLPPRGARCPPLSRKTCPQERALAPRRRQPRRPQRHPRHPPRRRPRRSRRAPCRRARSALLHQDLRDGPVDGGGDLRVDLVGGDLEERLVALDRVALLLQPLQDRSLDDRLAELRHLDRRPWSSGSPHQAESFSTAATMSADAGQERVLERRGERHRDVRRRQPDDGRVEVLERLLGDRGRDLRTDPERTGRTRRARAPATSSRSIGGRSPRPADRRCGGRRPPPRCPRPPAPPPPRAPGGPSRRTSRSTRRRPRA